MPRRKLYATDHRAVVLESVATNPKGATLDLICDDCASPSFTRKNVSTMISQLRKEGLIGRDDADGHFITKAGLDWLAVGRFDRALPREHQRPGSRKRKTT